MRICIDVQSAITQPAGVGRYTRQLVQHLGAGAGADEVVLFYFDFRRQGVRFGTPKAVQRAVRWIPGRLVQHAWKRLRWPPFNWFAGRADAYHFPNFIVPPLRAGRSVVTIHDLGFLRFPEFTEDRNYRYLTARIGDTVRRADAVITVSQFTADEARELLRVPADRLFPVHSGVSEIFRPPPAEQLRAVLARFGLDRPYLLSVGTIEPRKNLPFLVEVFEQLQDFDGYLVLAGGLGWKYEPILERLRNSKRRADIRHLAYVGDAELPSLYAGASAFLMTSFYEGFGFPPLEAMACGTPVVSSDGGSLREVLAGAATICSGFHADLWAESVRSVLGDPALRASRIAAGRALAAGYTWSRAASRTWDVYRQAVKER